jgi:hypothetical protein
MVLQLLRVYRSNTLLWLDVCVYAVITEDTQPNPPLTAEWHIKAGLLKETPCLVVPKLGSTVLLDTAGVENVTFTWPSTILPVRVCDFGTARMYVMTNN